MAQTELFATTDRLWAHHQVSCGSFQVFQDREGYLLFRGARPSFLLLRRLSRVLVWSKIQQETVHIMSDEDKSSILIRGCCPGCSIIMGNNTSEGCVAATRAWRGGQREADWGFLLSGASRWRERTIVSLLRNDDLFSTNRNGGAEWPDEASECFWPEITTQRRHYYYKVWATKRSLRREREGWCNMSFVAQCSVNRRCVDEILTSIHFILVGEWLLAREAEWPRCKQLSRTSEMSEMCCVKNNNARDR